MMSKKTLYSSLISKNASKQSGQILLIVVLAMVVALTVALSVISHTVTNLKTAKQNEESQKAFQAAQSGLDQALQQINTNNTNGSSTLNNQANYSFNISNSNSISSTFAEVNNGDPINQDQGYDIWLSDYPKFTNPFTGSITLYWDENTITNCTQLSGNASSDPTISPALEVLVLSNVLAPQLSKYVYDPCRSAAPRPITNSSSTNSGGPFTLTSFNNKTYQYSVTIPVSSALIMKVVPIFNSTTMAMQSSGPTIPSQGKVITSTGNSGETVRKLQYFISYPQIPAELMQYAIISQ